MKRSTWDKEEDDLLRNLGEEKKPWPEVAEAVSQIKTGRTPDACRHRFVVLTKKGKRGPGRPKGTKNKNLGFFVVRLVGIMGDRAMAPLEAAEALGGESVITRKQVHTLFMTAINKDRSKVFERAKWGHYRVIPFGPLGAKKEPSTSTIGKPQNKKAKKVLAKTPSGNGKSERLIRVSYGTSFIEVRVGGRFATKGVQAQIRKTVSEILLATEGA